MPTRPPAFKRRPHNRDRPVGAAAARNRGSIPRMSAFQGRLPPIERMTGDPSKRDRLLGLLRGASRMLIFTGAGVSTGSGIPDFRGPNGVWKTRAPVQYQDFMTSEQARIDHWDYKLEGWPAFRSAVPTDTHGAIARLERAGRLLKVVTQNIDGLHSRAGTAAERLVELHGTNTRVECQTCRRQTLPDEAFEYFRRTRRAPRCPCGGYLKPATVSFGQCLKADDIRRAEAAASEADLVIALGSSLSVYPAASNPFIASRRNVPYVIVNRGPTEHDDYRGVTLRFDEDVQLLFPDAVAEALDH